MPHFLSSADRVWPKAIIWIEENSDTAEVMVGVFTGAGATNQMCTEVGAMRPILDTKFNIAIEISGSMSMT